MGSTESVKTMNLTDIIYMCKGKVFFAFLKKYTNPNNTDISNDCCMMPEICMELMNKNNTETCST